LSLVNTHQRVPIQACFVLDHVAIDAALLDANDGQFGNVCARLSKMVSRDAAR